MRVALWILVGMSVPAIGAEPEKPKAKLPLGKDTTLFTDPLDKDGYVDYESALNESLRGNIKPADNAVVVLVQAIGPKPEGQELPPSFYKWLDIRSPASKGEYLVPAVKFFEPEQMAGATAFGTRQQQLYSHPWKAADDKRHAEWLVVNDKPLALAVEASHCSAYFHPLVTHLNDGERGLLFAAPLGVAMRVRELAGLLALRATQRAGDGKVTDAWEDVFAAFRLGRLVSQGGTLLEQLIGVAIEQIAATAALVLLEHAPPTARQARELRDTFAKLPTAGRLESKLETPERVYFLEIVQAVHRDGVQTLSHLGGRPVKKTPPDKTDILLREAVDWAVPLKAIHHWFDRIEAIHILPTHVERVKEWEKLKGELKRLADDSDLAALSDVTTSNRGLEIKAAVSEKFSNAVCGRLLPDVVRVSDAVYRAVQLRANLNLAFALAEYHADKGIYPNKLSDLVPASLKALPNDVFSGNALKYSKIDTGYLLYSVGVNGADDGGKFYSDSVPGDDLGVRMPRERKNKQTPTLSTVDLAIVAAYILGMTLFGLWFSRQQKDLKTYFVGERNVGWFMVLVSIVATETSAVTFLSVPGTAYMDGGNMTFLQLSLGYILGRIVVAWLLLPMYMRGELFSAYQVLREKFGPGVQRVASALFLITRTVADGLRLYLTALVMQYVGWGIEVAVVVVGIVTIVYTYLGGMKAVLWTDLIQFVIKITGAVLAGVFVLAIIPGGWDTFVSVGNQANKFTWIDTSTNPIVAYTLWAGIIGGAVFSMASHGADQLMVQRYLCAKSLGQSRTALVLSGFTVFAQFVLFLLVGIGLFVAKEQGVFDIRVPDQQEQTQPAESPRTAPEVPGQQEQAQSAESPETAPVSPKMRDATKDEVFGLFIVTKMPVGVVGVLVAAILAAAMSTLSSSLNSSANAVVSDFLKPLMPGRSERQWVLISRVLTAVFGVAQIGVALVAHWSGSERSIVDRVLAVAGMTTGLVLGLFILGRIRRPIPSAAAMIGLTCGFVVVLSVWLPSQFGTAILAWPWFALVGAGTTVVVALLLSLLLARPDGPPATPANRSPQPGV